MNREELEVKILGLTPSKINPKVKLVSLILAVLGLCGLAFGFITSAKTGWVALLVATSLIIGIAVSGVIFSAIFQLTGTRWGRAYRRLGEASVVLMPIGLVGILLLLIGGSQYLTWTHEEHLTGGKHYWLMRGFWDVRILFALCISYGLSLYFLYYSLRLDFCLTSVSKKFKGRIASFVSKNIKDPVEEAKHCEKRLFLLSPIVLIGYALTFSMLGFDLIMALDYVWFSTLFGAWYFIGHLFSGLALLALVSIWFRGQLGLQDLITESRQRALATVMFAFCLINIDFFWSQYFCIWYANMPEETEYLIIRIHDKSVPWHNLSWISILAFFFIPFFALIFRKVKQSSVLLSTVSVIVVCGIFLARFIEIGPAILDIAGPATLSEIIPPLVASFMAFIGMLGAGFLAYNWFIMEVPVMPIGDEIFGSEFSSGEEH